MFYTQLGMRSLRNPRGANVLHALKWTPVIITSTYQVAGHAMVVSGEQGPNYLIVNPCGVQVVSFDGGADKLYGKRHPDAKRAGGCQAGRLHLVLVIILEPA